MAAAVFCFLAALAIVAAAGPHLPLHSWETVPAFIHTSSLNDEVFCDEDLDVIARFPAVTIEKWQGCNATAGCYVPGTGGGPNPACPTQQSATLASAAAIKRRRPNATVVTWFDSLRIYSQKYLNPDIQDIQWQSCVRNAVTPFLETHPAMLLHNSSGGLAEESFLNAHVYDHTQPAVRQFWRDACLNMTASGLIDGCGADASQQPGSYTRGLSPSVEAAWTQAHIAAVANATAAVSAQGGLILGKIAQQLGVSTNGVLQEGCGASNTTVNTLRSVAAAAAASGTRYVYECHSTGGSLDDLAAFLVGAGPDMYWGMGTWVYQECGGAASSWIPELGHPLGVPSADAVYQHPHWTRTFASGTSVLFNAVTGKGNITWAA